MVNGPEGYFRSSFQGSPGWISFLDDEVVGFPAPDAAGEGVELEGVAIWVM